MLIFFYSFWFCLWLGSLLFYSAIDMKDEMNPGKTLHLLTFINLLLIVLIIYFVEFYYPESGWRFHKNICPLVNICTHFPYWYIKRIKQGYSWRIIKRYIPILTLCLLRLLILVHWNYIFIALKKIKDSL